VTFVLHQGDCREVMKAMPDASVDSIVCDPPYELGFMGKGWDSSGIANDVTVWAEALRVLKPGGHLLAFSGSRTYHRMVCAIEDAGFEVRDQMMWIYGSGFPKSLDVSKAIDSAAGATRAVVGQHIRSGKESGTYGAMVGNSNITAPATDAARQWDGWGTALKPAHEPICVARKPLIGTVAANVLAHGTGALNIDGCRIEAEPMRPNTGKGALPRRYEGDEREASTPGQPHDLGRWPANVIHDGSAEVLAAFPMAPGQIAPVKYGDDLKTGGIYGAMKRDSRPGGFGNVGAEKGDPVPNGPQYCDTGSAARFFYCAKASKEDRNEGCGGLPVKTGGMVSNTSGQHITRRDGGAPGPTANHHPTVKPTDLMAHLCRLVTPPGGTVLDPFMGSGSTGKAAVLEGFNFIGIDLSAEYLAIARARIEHAQRQGHQPSLDLEAA